MRSLDALFLRQSMSTLSGI